MTLPKEITKRLNNNNRVVVFTQDLDIAKMFLLKEAGRWTVSVNPRYWRIEDFVHDGIMFGNNQFGPGDQAKVMVGNHHSPDVGFDKTAKRLIFTKNPHFPLEPQDFIIKDEFYYGKLSVIPSMNYTAAIQQWTPLVICARDLHQYFHVNDNLTLLDIPHSTKSSSKILPIHLMNHVVPVQAGTTVIAYGFKSIYELMAFHEAKEVMLVYDKDYDIPTYDRVEKIMKCFVEMPDQAITPDYIAFKTMAHETKIRNDLDFMTYTGAIVKGQTHAQEITIRKTGENQDEMFQRIPEGTFRIDKLMNYLLVGRDNLIHILKTYQGDIEFSYIPSNHNLFYFAKDDIDHRKYNVARQFYTNNLQMVKQLELEGVVYLNRIIESRIEKHCASNRMAAVLHRWGVLNEIRPSSEKLTAYFSQSPPQLDQ